MQFTFTFPTIIAAVIAGLVALLNAYKTAPPVDAAGWVPIGVAVLVAVVAALYNQPVAGDKALFKFKR